MTQNKRKTSVARRGFTLVELMVSLSIFSLMSTAIGSLMFYAYSTSRYTRSENELVQQVESAIRRIVDNTRSASTLGPSFSETRLDEFTQADADHSNLKYEIQYYVTGGNLVESHDLYGTNVLVPGVTNFAVTTLQATTPMMLQVTISASDGTNTVTRTCDITARNF
jgi:prepilin-type N-terminal cleavage/methylation domain-containing protein